MRDLRISDPGYCEAQVFVGGGERLLLVIMAFGPVQDCPSGCIQRHATALVRGERIVPVAGRNMLPDSSASWDIALRQALSENGISDAATQELRSESNDGRCSAPATLESEGDDDVYWVFRLLTPKTCVGWRLGKPTGLRFEVDGEVRIYLTGTPLARPLRVSILTP